MAKKQHISERFWSKVDSSAGPDACHPFIGCRNQEGYGGVLVDGISRKAHRIAWELAIGPIPDGLLVLHHCDNPPCCNVRHLWLGTDADNNADMMRKGRNRQQSGDRNGSRLHPERLRRGANHPKTRLTDEQVREIRALKDRVSQESVAMIYEIDQTTVSRIQLRQTWKHVI